MFSIKKYSSELKNAGLKAAWASTIISIFFVLSRVETITTIIWWLIFMFLFMLIPIIKIIVKESAETGNYGEAKRPEALFGGLGTGLMWLSFIAQMIILIILTKHLPGEKLGYGSIALTIIIIGAGWIAVPGWIIGIARIIIIIKKMISGDGREWGRLIYYLLLLLLPVIFQISTDKINRMVYKKPEIKAPTAKQQENNDRVAGRAWAQENSIFDESLCDEGNNEFIAGCKSQVRNTKR